MAASTLSEQLAIRNLGRSKTKRSDIQYFVSTHNPSMVGKTSPRAFGGCALGVAIHAACQSVWSPEEPSSSTFRLYSVLGHFLGPAKTDRRLSCEVFTIRDSRTFRTRRVVVAQTLDDGTVRECLALTADFMKMEKMVELEYSPLPSDPTGHGSAYFSSVELGPQGERSVSPEDLCAELIRKGNASQKDLHDFKEALSLILKFWDYRFCRDGSGGQNLNGMLKHIRTDQHQSCIAITEKTSCEWVRVRDQLGSEAENMAALGFQMDFGLSYLPLAHDEKGKFIEDVGACGTLDFALRIFQSGDEKLAMDEWKLKERKTVAAAGGRTFSEGRLWDRKGNLVASMNQTCILRSKTTEASKCNLKQEKL
jgi:acyl-CoA thioesterase II